MNWLAWAADVAILWTYARSTHGPVRPFHWANAIGGIPLAVVEVQAGAWQVLPITVAFTLLGWKGALSK